jgi:hypothetical protein
MSGKVYVVVGCYGAGKSRFINLVKKSITDISIIEQPCEDFDRAIDYIEKHQDIHFIFIRAPASVCAERSGKSIDELKPLVRMYNDRYYYAYHIIVGNHKCPMSFVDNCEDGNERMLEQIRNMFPILESTKTVPPKTTGPKQYAIVGATNSGKNHFKRLVFQLYPKTDVNQLGKWMGADRKYITRMECQKKTRVYFIYIRATAETCVERMMLSDKKSEFEWTAKCSAEEDDEVVLAHMKQIVSCFEKKYYIPYDDACSKNGNVAMIDGHESNVIVVENNDDGDEYLIQRIHDIFGGE